jgi:hypothetical protein
MLPLHHFMWRNDMASVTIPNITAQQAQAAVNYFLIENLPDRFTADQARFDLNDQCWHVSVVLAYPHVGAIGQVGEVRVAGETAAVVAHTSLEEMRQTAAGLYQAHRHEIEAAFP